VRACPLIQEPVILKDSPIETNELYNQDNQWTRIVELELVPQPSQPNSEITELHHGMRDGVLKVKLWAATAEYMLRKWIIDCSPDHGPDGPEYRLWLGDHLSLYGVKNALLAPGYRFPVVEHGTEPASAFRNR